METKYIKTDNNTVINEKTIRWIHKMGDCLEVCSKQPGCSLDKRSGDTHRICKLNSPESYNKLNVLFN